MESVVIKRNGSTPLDAHSQTSQVNSRNTYCDNHLLISPINLVEDGETSHRNVKGDETQIHTSTIINNIRSDPSSSISDGRALDLSIDGVAVAQSLQTALCNFDTIKNLKGCNKILEVISEVASPEINESNCSIKESIFRNSNNISVISEETSSFIDSFKDLKGGIEDLLGREVHPLLHECYKKRQAKRSSLRASVELLESEESALAKEIEKLRDTVSISIKEEEFMKEHVHSDSDKCRCAIVELDEAIQDATAHCGKLELERIRKLNEVYGVVVTAEPSYRYTCRSCDESDPTEVVVPGNNLLDNIAIISKEMKERLLEKERDTVSELRNELEALNIRLQDLGVSSCDKNVSKDGKFSFDIDGTDHQSGGISALGPLGLKEAEERQEVLEEELIKLREMEKFVSMEYHVRTEIYEQELDERLALCLSGSIDDQKDDGGQRVTEIFLHSRQYISEAVEHQLKELDEKTKMEISKGEATTCWVKSAEKLISHPKPYWWQVAEGRSLISPEDICNTLKRELKECEDIILEKEMVLDDIEKEVLNTRNSETESDHVSCRTHDFDNIISFIGMRCNNKLNGETSLIKAAGLDRCSDYRLWSNDNGTLTLSSSSSDMEDYATLLPQPLSGPDYISSSSPSDNNASFSQPMNACGETASTLNTHCRAIEESQVPGLPTMKDIERITKVAAMRDISKAHNVTDTMYDNTIPLRIQQKISRWWELENNEHPSRLLSEENGDLISSSPENDSKVVVNIIRSYTLENLLTMTARAHSQLQERRSELNSQAEYELELEERGRRGGMGGKLAAFVGGRGTTVSTARYLRALFGKHSSSKAEEGDGSVAEKFEHHLDNHPSNTINDTTRDDKNDENTLFELSSSPYSWREGCEYFPLVIPCGEPMYKRQESLRELNSLIKEHTALINRCQRERDEIQQLKNRLGVSSQQDGSENNTTIGEAKLEREYLRTQYILIEQFIERENDQLDTYIYLLKHGIKENLLASIGISGVPDISDDLTQLDLSPPMVVVFGESE